MIKLFGLLQYAERYATVSCALLLCFTENGKNEIVAVRWNLLRGCSQLVPRLAVVVSSALPGSCCCGCLPSGRCYYFFKRCCKDTVLSAIVVMDCRSTEQGTSVINQVASSVAETYFTPALSIM